MLEEYLLSLIIQSPFPKKTVDEALEVLTTFMPKERAYQKILTHVVSHFSTQDHFDSNTFTNYLPQELTNSYDTCFLYPLPKFADEQAYLKEVKNVSEQLKQQYIKSRMKVLSEKMSATDAAHAPSESELELLQKEFAKLSAQLQK